MNIKVKKIQSIVIIVLTFFIVFAYFSNSYAWHSIRKDFQFWTPYIKVVNNYEIDVSWYVNAGKIIAEDTLECV